MTFSTFYPSPILISNNNRPRKCFGIQIQLTCQPKRTSSVNNKKGFKDKK